MRAAAGNSFLASLRFGHHIVAQVDLVPTWGTRSKVAAPGSILGRAYAGRSSSRSPPPSRSRPMPPPSEHTNAENPCRYHHWDLLEVPFSKPFGGVSSAVSTMTQHRFQWLRVHLPAFFDIYNWTIVNAEFRKISRLLSDVCTFDVNVAVFQIVDRKIADFLPNSAEIRQNIANVDIFFVETTSALTPM